MKYIFILLFLISFLFSVIAEGGTLIIYDNGTALFQDSLRLDNPTTRIRIPAPMSVVPNSLSFLATEISLKEYTFHPMEKITEDEILKRSLGKVIHILQSNGTYISGTLLAIEGSDLIIRSGVSVYILPRNSFYVNIPEISSVDQNTYFDVKLRKPIELLPYIYQVKGISWRALYTLHVLNGNRGILSAKCSMDNETDKTFEDINCILFSGRIYTTENIGYRPSAKRGVKLMAEGALIPSPKGVGGYYIYPLKERITLPSNKRIYHEFLSPRMIELTKKYTFDFEWGYGTSTFINADMMYIIHNDERSRLYLPFPKGQFRIYKDMNNTDILLGEVNIDDTSRGEDVKLKYGKAYDILAKKVIKEKRKLSKNHYLETIAFVVKNNSNEKVVVEIHDRIPSIANITYVSNDVRYEHPAAGECVFFIPLEKKEEFSFTYGVDFAY